MGCFIADEELDRVVLPSGHYMGRGLSHPGWNSGNPHPQNVNSLKIKTQEKKSTAQTSFNYFTNIPLIKAWANLSEFRIQSFGDFSV